MPERKCMMDKREEELQHQMEAMKKIRASTGMNRRQFSDYMGIPLRTLEEWESGRRKMPGYVLRLIAYQVEMEKYREEHGGPEFDFHKIDE